MGNKLSEMTLEELWELFPIFLVQHDDKWKDDYRKMEVLIQDLLSDCPVERISHIGSTAIQGIWAKDIVDVMVEIAETADIHEMVAGSELVAVEILVHVLPLFCLPFCSACGRI